ncbi:related to rRNA biogenesis protein RRP36 [Ustilago bromivora]|uniref:rRNA biogenesis protein RRP36 n=1 Tax=Ustilago bromivora TaxID=307758 RepID=A0A1K0GYB2_9BASI|nr:related to rRNA biogenesis protein RRP36 [Ustilago bromivora]SYW76665.1 related to rRNA biogenesis protein RRP36 [Ustilago bromivora]
MVKKPSSNPKQAAVFQQDSDSDAGSLQLESGSELGSDLEGSDDAQKEAEEEEEEEEERLKYAQFMDDSDLEEASDDSQDDSEEEEEELYSSVASDSDDVDDLQQQMKQIPFSALMKARQQLGEADDDGDFSDDPDISDLEEDEFAADRRRLASSSSDKGKVRSKSISVRDDALEAKRQEVRERLRQLSGSAPSSSSSAANGENSGWAESRAAREARRLEKERKELAKRSNKNAPTEMSSKRPVSRRRNVVDTPSTSTAHLRDPRFESLSGSTNKDLFSKSYSFLPDMFKDELSTLKKTLTKLKRQEATQAGPKAKSEQALAIREERAKVEAALRRAEGLAGERERRQRESVVKGKIKRENKERVEKGLQPFYPKQREIKQLLLKDKYDKLAGGGGDGGKRVSGQEKKQLKKALERRRRKNAQKEKRDMPAGIGFAREGQGAAVPKRRRMVESRSSGQSPNKRARF